MKNAIFITIIVATCIIHTFSFAQTGTLAVTRKIANETIDPYLPDPNPPREIPGYHYVWGDEFNYEGNVDQTLWQAEKGFIRGNELQYYQMKNATVSEGRLLISAKKERVKNEFYDPNSSDYRKNTEYSQYTSASILGKQKRYFLFGRIEVRAKVDTAGGNFPAIWTCGYNKNWPQNGEIDIMEYYWANIENKYQPVLTANFCVGGDNRQDEWAQKWKSTFTPLSYYTAKDADWVNKYHVWRMDWDEEAISLYLDDELRNTLKIKDFKNYDGSIAFYNPQFMMLNLAVKVQRAGDYLSPTKFEVDYFRVYQKMIDTEKPSMVTGLKASNVSATTCTLSWDPSTDNVGVYRYDIYKNGLADGYFVGSATDTSFIVKGLSPSSKADFRVLALDSVGNYSDVHEPLSVSTPPTDFVEDGEIYTIINCNSGKVLTPLHSSRVSGTNIVQMTGSDDPAQKWVFADMGNGYWTIKNMDN